MFGPMRRDDPDDDDDFEPEPDRGNGEKIAVAVAIAGLSTLVVKLVEWGVEKVREKFEAKKEEDE